MASAAPDRIAIISDIHGNLPALEAVLADIAAHDIAHIMCLGDLVGKGPDGAQVVDICRAVCEATVRGNWDDIMASASPSATLTWHRERLGSERLAYLAALLGTLDFVISGRQVRLLHASPQGVYHRVHMYDTRETHEAMFANTPFTGAGPVPSVVGYGDIHSTYMHCRRQRILFNVGSVGNPLDITAASYAILEGSYGSAATAPFEVRLRRVPYDIERAVDDAARVQMPHLAEYADELRTARYRGSPRPPT